MTHTDKKTIFAIELGQRIRLWRQKRFTTIEDLALEVGIPLITLSRLETGHNGHRDALYALILSTDIGEYMTDWIVEILSVIEELEEREETEH